MGEWYSIVGLSNLWATCSPGQIVLWPCRIINFRQSYVIISVVFHDSIVQRSVVDCVGDNGTLYGKPQYSANDAASCACHTKLAE